MCMGYYFCILSSPQYDSVNRQLFDQRMSVGLSFSGSTIIHLLGMFLLPGRLLDWTCYHGTLLCQFDVLNVDILQGCF